MSRCCELRVISCPHSLSKKPFFHWRIADAREEHLYRAAVRVLASLLDLFRTAYVLHNLAAVLQLLGRSLDVSSRGSITGNLRKML